MCYCIFKCYSADYSGDDSGGTLNVHAISQGVLFLSSPASVTTPVGHKKAC